MNEKRPTRLSIRSSLKTKYLASLILGIFVAMGMFGATMFLPLFVQGVVGLDAQSSGLVYVTYDDQFYCRFSGLCVKLCLGLVI